MTLRRALPLVLVLAALLEPAVAQVGGTPGAPPAACQHLLVVRDEVQRDASALTAAGQRKAGPEEACRLFNVFLGSQTKMIRGLEQHSSLCRVPADVVTQIKTSHATAERQGKQVCDAAASVRERGVPSLNDGLVPAWPFPRGLPDRPPAPYRLRLATDG